MRPGRVPGSAPLACTGRAPGTFRQAARRAFKGLRGGIHQLATATGNDYIRPNGRMLFLTDAVSKPTLFFEKFCMKKSAAK
jgi:hypothetical protein